MRSTLSTKELDIQLKRQTLLLLTREGVKLPRDPVLVNPTLQPNVETICILPKKFRELRALAISHWYLPDFLKFEINLEIRRMFPYSLDFENEGRELSLELQILTESQRDMVAYLRFQERFSARELFGTILHDDLLRALGNLKLYVRNPETARRKVRRKGYQDHGSRRPDDRWTESSDWSFTEYQNLKEERFDLLVTQFSLLKETLETWDPDLTPST